MPFLSPTTPFLSAPLPRFSLDQKFPSRLDTRIFSQVKVIATASRGESWFDFVRRSVSKSGEQETEWGTKGTRLLTLLYVRSWTRPIYPYVEPNVSKKDWKDSSRSFSIVPFLTRYYSRQIEEKLSFSSQRIHGRVPNFSTKKGKARNRQRRNGMK